MQVHILKGQRSSLSCIAEVHIFKDDLAVLHFLYGIRLILHLRNLLQHLLDTVRGSLGDHIHNEYEGYHHQGHEDLNGIDHDAGQLSRLHGAKDDILTADEDNDDDHRIHHELHDRGVPGNDLLRLGKELEYQKGDTVELLDLVVLPDIGLYHPGCVDIFLYVVVQDIILIEDLNEQGVGLLCDEDQGKAQKGRCHQKQHGHLDVDGKGHDPGKDHHDGSPGQKPDGHHVSHLHIGDIRGHTGHQA